MSDIVIKVENISKQYRLGKIGTGTMSHDLKRWFTVSVRGKEDPYLKVGQENILSSPRTAHPAPRTPDFVWALKDINFEVKQGEVLGIIGKNGAGKSTLLKILSRVTTPTTGMITARGRIASLLEVGTGFHPEMTGRENIYMNGSIMGMTKTEITRKLDEIVDFSGVEKYIDTPVKRYSSGMTVRLGFAIAAHLEPEILVVDEVLAVGDAEFQKKAIGKMHDVSRDEGRTVLFVSHNMAAIIDLCSRGILIKNGSIVLDDEVKIVVQKYLTLTDGLSYENKWDLNDAPGNDIIKLRKVYFVNEDLRKINLIFINQKFGFCIEYEVLNDVPFFTHGINVFNGIEVHLFTSHDINEYERSKEIIKGVYKTIVWIPSNLLQTGDVVFSFACMRYNPFEVLFHQKELASINVIDTMDSDTRNEHYRGNLPGLVRPVLDWNIRKLI